MARKKKSEEAEILALEQQLEQLDNQIEALQSRRSAAQESHDALLSQYIQSQLRGKDGFTYEAVAKRLSPAAAVEPCAMIAQGQSIEAEPRAAPPEGIE